MSIEGQGHFFTIYFQVLYALYFTRPRYQVRVYRTIGPLVILKLSIIDTCINVVILIEIENVGIMKAKCTIGFRLNEKPWFKLRT